MHQWLLDHAREFTVQGAAAEAVRLRSDPVNFATEIHRRRTVAVSIRIWPPSRRWARRRRAFSWAAAKVPGPEPSPALMERILDQMDRMMIR